jgi:hypothetical protein
MFITEDNWQKAACLSNQITTEHGLTTYLQTTKMMTFKGRDPVGSKIVTGNRIIEQVNSFKYEYLENLVSYEKEVDIDNKSSNYLIIIKNN